MNELGFFYIESHEAWLYTPNTSLIFMNELFTKTDEEIAYMVFDRTGENPSEWLIERLKYPFENE